MPKKSTRRCFSSSTAVCAVALLAAFASVACAASPVASCTAACGQNRPSDPRAAIAAAEALPPHGINKLMKVEIGGIPQWVSIRGADPSNPILLFIAGGPGAPEMPESWTFQRPWEDFFTVVQWDQRGAGKTFSSANRIPDKSMTMAQMQADTEQLIGWLRQRYGKKKIYVLGFSFGSILGLRVALDHPDWLYAYIGVGQVVNAQRNEVVGYRETLARAESTHDEAAIKALKALAPYPNPSGPTPISKILQERRWDAALGGMRYSQPQVDSAQLWALSPDYSDDDVKSAELGELSSVEILVPQIENIDFDDDRNFACPVFFFAGKQDKTTPSSIVAAYYKTIHAPVKRLFLIDNAAHYVMNDAPGKVLMDLVKYVRPLSQRPSSSH
ncbi:MAG: alpha/beta fold hydrolase [Rhodanobacteraceae bacterium]